ncbi:MAG: TAT-variant-translocated molybdopterin oxidoreductase [Verrucomicrobia bacterium]|nr:TAT-variant-translocated molybdopterin oxidoreductase [Verrucomicrobiota bacterium]
MKRVFQHPPEQPTPTGRKYWRSLGELRDTPEFREFLGREFPAGAAEMEGDGLSRRNFMQLMGASLALAGFGLSGCRRPESYLVPFAKSVEWLIPGKPLFYATAMPRRRGAMPLIAECNDGRPTKLEGNPLHPASNGATDPIAQCSLLDLYDPDRARRFLDGGSGKLEESDGAKFAEWLKTLRESLGANGGVDTAILMEQTHSPTLARIRAELAQAFPALQWVIYDPLRPFNEAEAMQAAFGDGVMLKPRFDKADVILALDSDFLNVEEGGLTASRDFSNRRRVAKAGDAMSRLYVVENRFTLTGGMADHRLRCAAGQIAAVAVALARKLGAAGDILGAIPGVDELAGRVSGQEKWIAEAANDLTRARGKGLVVVGPRQPGIVHLLAWAINSTLGNLGNTLVGLTLPERTPESKSISLLAEAINANKVKNLFILGGNPAYNALAHLNWPALQKKVANVVRLGYYEDETTAAGVRWQVPMAHYLESWGDARGEDGTYMAIQPMILPLFGGWSELDLLAGLLGHEKNDKPDLVRDTFKTLAKPAGDFGSETFEGAWNEFLRNGFLADSGYAERAITLGGGAGAYVTKGAPIQLHPAPTPDALEVVLAGDYKVDDGRYLNNGWLQEMPDPVTRLSWDNAALISPAMGKRYGLDVGDIVDLTAENGTRVRAAVWLAPGHADNSVTLSLGYGRKIVGRVGGESGFNAYPLRTAEPNQLDQTYIVSRVKLAKAAGAGRYLFATMQEHQSMEGRNIVRELPKEIYEKNTGFDEHGRSFVAKMGMDEHIPANIGIYQPARLDGMHQWGMAIDLNTCTGCNACVAACQSENNIPIVGKAQVVKGRIMHWMRIDRYYSTLNEQDEDPQALHQPMLCQHCENAPCETVCPVNATVHSEEGLNLQAYNRCIGTRYCSNNCPYKVRRFNFFNYNERSIQPQESGPFKGETSKLYLGPLGPKGMPEIEKLQKNPNVTVRMRGVMEKCTFCIQRIEEAKIGALRTARDSDNKKVPRDSFKTACQQVCPTEAIVFGDLTDPESKVSKVKEQDRDYKVLEYLNVRPRVSYQARLRNPNPAMPGAEHVGKSIIDNPPEVQSGGHNLHQGYFPGAHGENTGSPARGAINK